MLPTPALTLTSGSYTLAREYSKFPYQGFSQPWIFHVLVGASTQFGMAYLQFKLFGWVLQPSPVRDSPCPVLALMTSGYFDLPQPGLPQTQPTQPNLAWPGPPPATAIVPSTRSCSLGAVFPQIPTRLPPIPSSQACWFRLHHASSQP